MNLTNGKITLRALEPEDVDLLYNWENDPKVWKVSNTCTPLSKYILASYIKTADRDIWESHELRLVIETIEGKAVGTIELFDFEPYHSRSGLGILIADQEERRKGYASEACNLIEEYAKEQLGIYQLYVNIQESNIPSIRFFERQNYEQTGCKKHWIKTSMGWEDELILQKIFAISK